MIIKTTFNDSSYLNTLKLFWNKFLFCNYPSYKHRYDEDVTKYIEIVKETDELLDKAMYKENQMTKEEINKFIESIKESIIYFIEIKQKVKSKELEYLKNNLKIEIVPCIEDKFENNECLYYFLQNKQYIIQ